MEHINRPSTGTDPDLDPALDLRSGQERRRCPDRRTGKSRRNPFASPSRSGAVSNAAAAEDPEDFPDTDRRNRADRRQCADRRTWVDRRS